MSLCVSCLSLSLCLCKSLPEPVLLLTQSTSGVGVWGWVGGGVEGEYGGGGIWGEEGGNEGPGHRLAAGGLKCWGIPQFGLSYDALYTLSANDTEETKTRSLAHVLTRSVHVKHPTAVPEHSPQGKPKQQKITSTFEG